MLEDARALDPVERLLEESWESRSRRAGHRELIVEAGAAALFLAVAVPLAAPVLGRLPLNATLVLVGLYAIVSRTLKFPIGAGHVVPSYLVLVPMLLLLPPAAVPLLTAGALVLGTLGRWLARRARPEEVLFAVPDAWHALGPALVLIAAGSVTGVGRAGVYLGALLAGFLLDLIVSTLRESLTEGVAPDLQLRVIAAVWAVDACIAPLGLLIAHAARHDAYLLLLLLPANGLLMLVDRDRTQRIAEAQHRLGLVARERSRLQAAVHRLGDAFAAKLDLGALAGVVLHGCIDALDADAGSVKLHGPASAELDKLAGDARLASLLAEAGAGARTLGHECQLERSGSFVMALPLVLGAEGSGMLAVARRERPFREDERTLMRGLLERAQMAFSEILGHEALREQALSDPLTRLGNRRKLAEDLGRQLAAISQAPPLVLMLFDLDGFKTYNDTFGHVAGDALLARLGRKLAVAAHPDGAAYRLGGDEFCVLLPARRGQLERAVAAAAGALEEQGETFAISASCGTVLLPHEASTADYALQLADERMYARKQGRTSGAREQAHDVLIHIMQAREPALTDHGTVAQLAVRVGRAVGMTGDQLDELARAAALHDVGKVGIPDAILAKQGPLDAEEWDFVRQHTVLGERILSAAPALRGVATIVRATHERWDGGGYPDGLHGEEIPLAARIVAACEAYFAIITERCYRPSRSSGEARLELFREAGGQFDPVVISALLEQLDKPEPVPVPEQPHKAHERARLAAEVVSRVNELLDHAA